MKFLSRQGEHIPRIYQNAANVRGKFPIFDEASAKLALLNRDQAKTIQERLGIIRRATKFLPHSSQRAKLMDEDRGEDDRE